MNKRRVLSKSVKRYLQETELSKPVCKAPFISMSVGMTGYVSPCCLTQSFFAESKTMNTYPEKSLKEIWRGEAFNNYRKKLKRNRFPQECKICEDSLLQGNFKTAKMRMYEGYKPHRKYPVMLEIAIDNTCNLECIMCNSLFSSKIADKKAVKYDNGINYEQFRKELQEMIPHLQECIFSGGESFLSKTYRDIWRDIIRVNPGCRISVNTNGTVLNEEIIALMEAGNFFLNISIDSVKKSTYEQIRKGASFEQLMKNLEYFIDYSKRKNTILSMPVCPLTLNHKEFPDIVRFCNAHGMFLEFVHVFNALDVNLQFAQKETLEEAYNICSNAHFEVEDRVSEHNIKMLEGLCNDLALWIRAKAFKEKFLSEIKPDKDKFNNAMEGIESKIKVYLDAHFNSDEAESRFNDWKNQKDKIFAELPDYFYDERIFDPVFALKTPVWYQYVSTMPMDEMIDFLKSFSERVISHLGSSSGFNLHNDR